MWPRRAAASPGPTAAIRNTPCGVDPEEVILAALVMENEHTRATRRAGIGSQLQAAAMSAVAAQAQARIPVCRAPVSRPTGVLDRPGIEQVDDLDRASRQPPAYRSARLRMARARFSMRTARLSALARRAAAISTWIASMPPRVGSAVGLDRVAAAERGRIEGDDIAGGRQQPYQAAPARHCVRVDPEQPRDARACRRSQVEIRGIAGDPGGAVNVEKQSRSAVF